jgi:hypothetical protein
MTAHPMKPRSFKCDDPTWDAASRGATERGENLSEEIRRFLRRRYGKPRPAAPPPTSPDQSERPAWP